jgi:Tol biopolymer transport system component
MATAVPAETSSEPERYYVNPIYLPDGNAILATDDSYNSLYLISLRDGTARKLLCELGCGFMPSVGPNGTEIGVKIIRENMEIPCTLNLITGKVKELYNLVSVAGEVSFSEEGKIAFTVENDLIIIGNEGKTESIPLGVYANIAPISPDGSKVAFNDENDQILLIDLESGERTALTHNDRGYFGPRWSPDSKKILFSTLDGCIVVVEIETGRTYELGKGLAPQWAPDSIFICYHLLEVEELRRVVSSEICVSSYNGDQKYQVTDTPGLFEMHPSFSPDGTTIVYDTFADRRILAAKLGANFTISLPKQVARWDETQKISFYDLKRKETEAALGLDVPYIHQVYDTPDWFNGSWACAPATAMMAIIYFRKLPEWDCTVSAPFSHTSHWGRYICEKYNYRGVTYDWQARDASSNWGKGGYGYMWSGSNSPHTVMDDYISNHGITSWHTDNPTWSQVIGELDLDYPYPLCVGLTTSGHLILATGYVSGQHTLIFNDPYGNKNTPGYPSYDGKGAQYDWPGYNHGNMNLNTVYWAVGARGSFPSPSETLVDDLALYDGFFMFTAPEKPKDYWWWFSENSGWDGNMWWTYTEESQETYYATWTPDLPEYGYYEVSAYIPATNATATSARYTVYYSGGSQTVIVDQEAYPGQWVSLGGYQFDAGRSGYVRLGDATGVAGEELAFDAMKFVKKIPVTPTPTPAPTASPTSSPTPTPTATPTPTPTPWQIVFDFVADREDWTSRTVPVAFSEPDFSWEPDFLKMTSHTNTNTFGYWQCGENPEPLDTDYLYRARYRVMTNIADQSLVPQIRLRANSLNLQQYDVLSIESAGSGAASPGPSGTDYDLYFVVPPNDISVMLAFDLLNFNPDDAAEAELALDTVTVDRFALDSLPPATVVKDYTFELTTDGWTTSGAPLFFSAPQYRHTAGALELRSITNTNTFGYWVNDPADITIQADRLYRGTFEVRTDLSNPSLVPEMRLRFNVGNLQASQTFGISSAGDGANSPGTTTTTYDRLYFLPPANCVGENLNVSFDILNFNPYDAPEASLLLDRAVIETIPLPASP